MTNPHLVTRSRGALPVLLVLTCMACGSTADPMGGTDSGTGTPTDSGPGAPTDSGPGAPTDSGPGSGTGGITATITAGGATIDMVCDPAMPPNGGMLAPGGTNRIRITCFRMVGRGWQQISLIVERSAAFAAGSYDLTNASDGDGTDSLAVIMLDESGNGFQYASASTNAWTGTMTLDEVGETGGVVRGSMTGSWTRMQPMTMGAPSGEYVDRPGMVSITFSFPR